MAFWDFLFKPKPKPPVEYLISGGELADKLHALNFKELLINDARYWYVSVNDWVNILSKTRANMPAYLTDKFDCEDFAFVTAVRVMLESKLNGCMVAIGNSPLGYHGWNLVLTTNEFYYFEPQTGEFWPVIGGTAAYSPDRIITV